MSNRIEIELTKFVDINNKGSEGNVMYGYRIYDNYANVYNNTFESLESLNNELNDNNFWEVLNNHDEFSGVDELSCSGISFNDTFYTWGDIEDIKDEIQRRDEKIGLYPDKEDISNW